ncbi:hypothetical protein [Emticicia sp.]|uniref:hypothetical protein n=1 Tax=Emticicia sp. TaxID=1930953 RepID=UPI003750FE0B
MLILFWSVVYSWFWNCNRKSYCSGEMGVEKTTNIVKVVSAEEQILFMILDVYFNVNKSSIIKNAEVENFISIDFLRKYFMIEK